MLGGIAHAQSSPAVPPAPQLASVAPAGPARIDDIQVSHESGKVSILVRLSQQPTAASVTANGDTAVVQIDGVMLARLSMIPRTGSMVTRVEAADGKLTLWGAALSAPTTVIYRNAVLIEAKLADPVLRSGTSLLSAPPSPAPVPLAAPTPPPAPPAQTAALESKPAAVPAGPIPLAPPAKQGEQKKPDQAVSTSLPPVASLVKIDAARCTAAAGEVAKDPWAVKALGDHALCMLDAGKIKEAQASLDQLAAFAPDDWRVALGRAALDQEKGDASKAEAGYRAAAKLAPDDGVRAAISTRITSTQLNLAAGH
jgi:hypothetical protein